MMKNKALFQIFRRMLSMTLALGTARIINALASFICLMMTAQSGKSELAAAALAVSTMLAIFTFITTVFYATGILIRFYSNRSQSPVFIGILVKNSCITACLIALPAALLLYHMDTFLQMMGQDMVLVQLTSSYFHFAGPGLLPLLIMMIIGQFFVGTGQSYMPLIIEIISLPLILLASYTFVLGHFGCPTLGLGGVSLSQLLVQTLLCAIFICLLCFQKRYRIYQFFPQSLKPDWAVCRQVLTLGLPIGIQFGGELAAMAVCGYIAGYFGINTLAALQIVNQYSLFFFLISLTLGHSLAMMISETYGHQQKDSRELFEYFKASCIIFALYSLPAAAVFCLFPLYLYQLYTGYPPSGGELVELLQWFFILSALFMIIDGVRTLLSAALRGLQDTRYSMWVNLSSLWLVSLPCAAYSVFVLHKGPVSMRAAFLSGFALACVLLMTRFYRVLFFPRPSPLPIRERG